MKNFYFGILLIAPILFTASCGGGGGSGGGPTTNNTGSISNGTNNGSWDSSVNSSLISSYRTLEYNNNWGLEKIRSAEAYAVLSQNGKIINGSGIKVGVADTGVQTIHPEISVNFKSVGSYDFVNNDSDVSDDNGHGTFVSGVIAGTKGNDGIHGVAFGADLIIAKVLDSGGYGSDSAIASGINNLISNQAKVINLSLGGDNPEPAIYNSLVSGKNNGVLFTIATGNGGDDDIGDAQPSYPASYASDSVLKGYIIAVGAIDSSNVIASFSNNCGLAKDYCLVAPGINITSSYPTTIFSSGYASGDGTSFASPHVAGAAAVLMGAWPTLTAKQVSQILLQTATDLGAPGVDSIYGHGLLNLYQAVQAQGQNTISFSSVFISGAGYDVRQSSINSSPIFGDSYMINIAPILQKAVFFDDFGRDYKANLNHKIFTSSTDNYNLDNLLFNNYQFAELPIASGSSRLKLKFLANNLEQDNFSGQTIIKKLGLKYLVYDKSKEDLSEINQANISFSYSKDFENGLKFNFSNNDLTNDLGQNPINKFSFIATNYNISPYLSLSRQDFSNNSTGRLDQKQFSLSQQLGKNFISNFSYFNSSQNYSFLKSGEVENKGLNTGLSYSVKDDLMLDFSYGNLIEYNDRFLGTKSYGAFSNQGNTSTNYLKSTLTKKIIKDLYFVSSYSEGKTNINGNDMGIFKEFNNVRSRAFSLALLDNKIWGGKLGVVYSEPLRVYTGSVNIDIPVGINSDGTINRLKADNVSLKPNGIERDIELFYGLNIDNFSKIDFNLLIRHQPGNVIDATTQYLYILKYNMKF